MDRENREIELKQRVDGDSPVVGPNRTPIVGEGFHHLIILLGNNFTQQRLSHFHSRPLYCLFWLGAHLFVGAGI
jgi:hypothetical protein